MTITDRELDPEALEAAAGRVMAIYAGAMLNYMIDLGHRTGLTAVLARGTGTAEELADRVEWAGDSDDPLPVNRFESRKEARLRHGDGHFMMRYQPGDAHFAEFDPVSAWARSGSLLPTSWTHASRNTTGLIKLARQGRHGRGHGRPHGA